MATVTTTAEMLSEMMKGFKEILTGFVRELEIGNPEDVYRTCRMLIDVIEMFDVPLDSPEAQAAFVTAAMGAHPARWLES